MIYNRGVMGQDSRPPSPRLESWKAVAGHLGVSVRTAQRWERSEGLPAHRHMHATLGSVYAFQEELDAWWASRPDLRGEAARRPDAIRSIAVLPFANLNRDLETEVIADGLTEELINTLTRIDGLGVVARTSVFHFKDKGADVREIGAALGVQAVIEGSVRRADGRLRVIAQLVDVATGHHVWSEAFESRRADVFSLQEDIAHALSAMLRADLGRRYARPRDEPGRSDVSPYERYLEGRYHWNRRTPAGFLKAMECFERALAEDPHLAPAWAGLAECYGMGTMVASTLSPAEASPKAIEAAERALRIDPTLAEAHAVLGFVRATFESRWKEAGEHFLKALELKPQFARAHSHYAGMVLAPTGRLAEAQAHMARAEELDPMSPHTVIGTGMLRLFRRQYEEAASAFQETLDLDPLFPWAFRGLGEIRLLQGRYEEAIEYLEKVEMPGLAAGFLGYCYAKLGRQTEALQCLRRMEEPGQPPVWYQVAALHLGLGDLEAVFHSLERLAGERSPGFHWLAVEPIWDPIRHDPRFARILAALGLAP